MNSSRQSGLRQRFEKLKKGTNRPGHTPMENIINDTIDDVLTELSKTISEVSKLEEDIIQRMEFIRLNYIPKDQEENFGKLEDDIHKFFNLLEGDKNEKKSR